MIRELRIYPAYKPSGVDWLGDVPSHWEVRRLKSICRFTYGDSLPAGARENENVPVYGSNGKVGFHSSSNASGPCLIIGRKGSFGKVHYSSDPAFAIDTTFFVDQRFTDTNIRWLYYLLLSLNLDAVSKDSAVPGLSREDAYRQIGLCPPLPEQRAIARYLDHVDRRIQRYIEAKEKSIALLQEARQAIIHRAVTRGLDPSVPLKPSGVEWIGDVPAHWEIRRAKYLYHEVNERSSTGAEELMSVSHKTGVTPRKKSVTMFRSETNVGYKLCRPGDIVINTMWAYMAALGVARQVGLVSPSYNVYRPIDGEEMNLDYIDPLLRTETYRTEYLVRSTGITVSRLRLYPDSFLDIPLLYPPVEEQAAIVAHLGKATAGIDAAIDNARRQVEFMTEYRASLIAHVVTGKLDVRAAAASLSPEPAEQEPVGRSPVS